jgi:cellular nucleic acid-binding protein
MATNIYILKLSDNKWYVGKSVDPIKRYKDHVNGCGSAWTTLYKPIYIEEIVESMSPFDEDKITKEYMSRYGIDNVRGGSYVQTELSETQKDALKIEIWAANDLCTRCGRSGHFVKDCYARTDTSGKNIHVEELYDTEWECEYCDRTFTTKFGCMVHERSCKEKVVKTINIKKEDACCYRCGRTSHYASVCYASYHIDGYEL